MAIQTQQLSDSLPQFASIFQRADRKGASKWRIVQWSDVDPSIVTPDAVTVLGELVKDGKTEPNIFENRTQALRFSKAYLKTKFPHASENGHWGVWEWVEGGATRYQTVTPILTEGSPTLPAVIRESRTEPYSPLVRVSEETNRRLREIAASDKITLQSVIDAAVKEHYRRWFFARADSAYQALREDTQSWADEMAERRAWDATLLDGIDAGETMPTDAFGSQTSGRERRRA